MKRNGRGDIRSFFSKRPRPEEDDSNFQPNTSKNEKAKPECTQTDEQDITLKITTENLEMPLQLQANTSYCDSELTINSSNRDSDLPVTLDIGQFGNAPIQHITDAQKYKLLKHPWTPSSSYNFKGDVAEGKRCFRRQWLTEFSSWLTYSLKEKGAFCRFCVLFRPRTKRGYQGAFIVKSFTRYKDFHNHANSHLKSDWHIEASERAKMFMSVMENENKSIVEQIDKHIASKIEENRKKIQPIMETIVFCGSHDMPLRGKQSSAGIFTDLLQFRADAGDLILQDHLLHAPKNAKYISVQVQNEMIESCSSVLRESIISEVKTAGVFSVIADETADISGTEQLSVGIRFVDTRSGNACVREEFLGFAPLKELSAKYISDTIISNLHSFGLDLSLLVGQGYDGCSTMSGSIGGVSAIIRNLYPKAFYFHCASHKLNLVVNDLNDVPEIRNTVGTIKEIIKFFRESVLRRKLIPNIPLFCETRWSAKYKSIRIFAQHFVEVMESLEDLKTSRFCNKATQVRANQLHSAASTSTFIICLFIMAKYSGILEPVTNILQGETVDLFKVKAHIKTLSTMFFEHRSNSEAYFELLLEEALRIAEQLDVEIKVPRLTKNQLHRANYNADSVKDYYRVSIFIPYIDSILMSLATRFSEENNIAFSLLHVHPISMKTINQNEFHLLLKQIQQTYDIDNLINEGTAWYDTWTKKPDAEKNVSYADLWNEAQLFFPSISKVIVIGLTLPATTCTAERSFSTMRRVKTWLRSTMADKRLSGLCMISVHRQKLTNDNEFITKCIEKFAKEQSRRLPLLFNP